MVLAKYPVLTVQKVLCLFFVLLFCAVGVLGKVWLIDEFRVLATTHAHWIMTNSVCWIPAQRNWES